MKTHTERWIFTQSELSNPKECHAKDEFVATVSSTFGRWYRNAPPNQTQYFNNFDIIVHRNGQVTNKFGDGSKGVPKELQKLANDCEFLTKNKRCQDYVAEHWQDVIVDENGNFIRFAK